MSWITVATPPFDSIEKFDEMVSKFGTPPEGMEARYVGSAAGGLRVVTFWESKEYADRFFAERLGPALARVLGPEPVGPSEVIGIDVARTYVREPVA